MNVIRLKILLSWLLFLACVTVSSFHHSFIAWFGYVLILMIRFGIPHLRPPVFIQRLCWALAGGLVLFFVLLFVNNYAPLPSVALRTGEIAGAIFLAVILIPMFGYAVYSDYTLFKRSNGDLNQHP